MAWHPFRNAGLKVVALAMGALLWFTVSGQQAERPVPDVGVVFVVFCLHVLVHHCLIFNLVGCVKCSLFLLVGFI